MTSLLDAWWLYSLLAGVGAAGIYLVNQQYKFPSLLVTIWRGYAPALMVLPLVFIVPWPRLPEYYLLVIGLSLLATVHDNLVFASADKFGAGPLSRIMPGSIILGFIAWIVLFAEAREELMAQPHIGVGVIICLCMCSFAVMMIKRDPVGWQVFLFLLPALVLAAIQITMHKMALVSGVPVLSAVIFYPFVQGLTIGTAATLWAIKKQGTGPVMKALSHRQMLLPGGLLALFVLGVTWLNNLAMVHAPNPGYVLALSSSTPFWVLAYNRIKKIPDRAHLIPGFLFVVSAIGLVLLTNQH